MLSGCSFVRHATWYAMKRITQPGIHTVNLISPKYETHHAPHSTSRPLPIGVLLPSAPQTTAQVRQNMQAREANKVQCHPSNILTQQVLRLHFVTMGARTQSPQTECSPSGRDPLSPAPRARYVIPSRKQHRVHMVNTRRTADDGCKRLPQAPEKNRVQRARPVQAPRSRSQTRLSNPTSAMSMESKQARRLLPRSRGRT